MKKKAMLSLVIVTALALAIFLANFNPASLVASKQGANDALIAEKMAAHIGVMAYLYSYAH